MQDTYTATTSDDIVFFELRLIISTTIIALVSFIALLIRCIAVFTDWVSLTCYTDFGVAVPEVGWITVPTAALAALGYAFLAGGPRGRFIYLSIARLAIALMQFFTPDLSESTTPGREIAASVFYALMPAAVG